MPLFLGFLLVAFTEKKQGLDDYLAGSLVLQEYIPSEVQETAPDDWDKNPPRPSAAGTSTLAGYLIIVAVLAIFLGPLVLSGIMMLLVHPSDGAGASAYDPFAGMRAAPENAGYWNPGQGSVAAAGAPVLWSRVADRTPFQSRSSFTVTVFKDRFWVISGTSRQEIRNDVWYSMDGSTRTPATRSAPFCPRYAHAALVHNDRLYVIGGFGEAADGSFKGRLNDVWYTDDGVNWTRATPSAGFLPRHYLSAASYAGKIWVTGGIGDSSGELNDLWSSPDGKTWTLETGSAPYIRRSAATLLPYGPRLWIFGGRNSYGSTSDSWWSENGRDWTRSAILPFSLSQGQGVAVLDSSLYAAQNELLTTGTRVRGFWRSERGDRWDELSGPPDSSAPSQEINHVLYDEYHLVSLHDRLWLFREYIAPDGTVTNDVWYAPAAVLSSLPPESRFMASATYGPSPFRVNFTDFSLNRPDRWTWDFGDGKFSSEKNPLHVFVNPGTYTVRLTVANAFWNQTSSRAIVVDAPVTAGKRWTLVQPHLPFDERAGYGMAEHAGRMWVAGGWNPSADYNDVWLSADGVTWAAATTDAAFFPRSGHGFLSLNGRLFVIGGLTHNATGFFKKKEICNNDVWSSSDGATWTLVTPHAAFSPRCNPTSLVYDNRLWIIGGRGIRDGRNPAAEYNDVWSSADGATWIRVNASSAITPRERSAAFVYDNAMWVFGARGDFDGELWRSKDGAVWTPVRPVQDVRLFSGPVPVGLVSNGRVLLVQDASWGSADAKPIWYSDDGTNWTRFDPEFSSESWRGSYISNGIVYNNRMWIIGDNEVWQSG